jgi:hypothetical protein
MFLEAFQFVKECLFDSGKASGENVSYARLSLVLLLATWLSWYTWRFSIRPALNPKEPKQMPYWIPGTLKRCSSTLINMTDFPDVGVGMQLVMSFAGILMYECNVYNSQVMPLASSETVRLCSRSPGELAL